MVKAELNFFYPADEYERKREKMLSDAQRYHDVHAGMIPDWAYGEPVKTFFNLRNQQVIKYSHGGRMVEMKDDSSYGMNNLADGKSSIYISCRGCSNDSNMILYHVDDDKWADDVRIYRHTIMVRCPLCGEVQPIYRFTSHSKVEN